MVNRVHVEPGLLQWAADRSGRGVGEFERKFESWHAWLEGKKRPTVRQIEDLARYAHVPFGVLFLTTPPEVELPIADYRLGKAARRDAPSQDLLEVISASQLRQDWYRDYALGNEIGPARVTNTQADTDVVAAAQQITRDLDFSVDRRRRLPRNEARNHLRHAFERLGGIAIFTSTVGNDTHRLLNRDEFRGFTLADPIAPLIFVNTADDTLSGQIFTFLHEYAHVTRGQSGVSDEDAALITRAVGGVEAWCNSVAAEVLVPADDLRVTFRNDEPLRVELDRLSQRYHASTLTILVKLRVTDLLPRQRFDELMEAETRQVAEILSSAPVRSGGDHYLNQPFRLGEAFSRAVINETYRGAVTYTEAFALLGMRSAEQIDTYARKLGLH